MIYGKVYMKFDKKKNKEYIFLKDSLINKEPLINNIGKTFIDFLANSDEIIKVLENAIYSYHKDDKLKDSNDITTTVKFELKKFSPFFEFFDCDTYISNYIENLRNKNHTEISIYLEKLRESEQSIKYCMSEQYYNEMIEEEISFYHDYSSKESKKGFLYIHRAEKATNEIMEKFTDKYGYRPSYNSWKKIYSRNKNAIKGDNIVDEIDRKIYDEHEIEIKKYADKSVQNSIKRKKDMIKLYKQRLKQYVKDNERTLEKIFDEYINIIKFWITFSKYTLIYFYDLSTEKHDNLSTMQRLLDYLLHINRTYLSNNIFKIPESDITLELYNGNHTSVLYKFIEKNRKELLAGNSPILNKLNTYSVNLIQEYSINSIEDFICISLMQILQNNIKVCKCENCNKLFISVNKSNEKYCTYKFKDNKTCRDMSYSIHLQKDELANILRKNYRTENARKNRNSHIPNIQIKFDKWYSEAKEKKKLCETGFISREEFNKWFIENKNWF